MDTTLTFPEYPENETIGQFLASFREMRLEHEKKSIDIEELKRIVKENSRLVGDLSNSFGELAEHLVAPNIVEKFQALGFPVDKSSTNIQIFKPDLSKLITEIDVLVENGELAIVVEIKSKFREKHLEEFFIKMEKFREYADRKQDKRKFLGAIGAAIINGEQRRKILDEGIFVIEQTGDTMKISVPDGFKPKEW